MKKTLLILLLAATLPLAMAAQVPTTKTKPTAKAPARAVARDAVLTTPAIEKKIDVLMAKMTLKEKIGQLVQSNSGWGNEHRQELLDKAREGGIGSFLNFTGADSVNEVQKAALASRLKIPLIFGFDVIHGYRTIYPIPLAESCSFDPALAERTTAMAAREASAAGLNWTFAPMVDIAHDARWGRIAEAAGEDVYVGSLFAAARVKGFQSVPGFAACAKHFVGYGAAESGREYNYTEISEHTLRETYLPPFKAAVDAGVMTLMSAFNDMDGIPASGNRHTLSEILRGEWGFQGFVVSDWASVEQLIDHGYAADKAEAAQKGLWAGVDMEMEGWCYDGNLEQLVKSGKLRVGLIDQAVRRVLRVKYKLGLFDHPLADPEKEQGAFLTVDNEALARESARKSIVLLRNEKKTLPLAKNLKKVAVIGPLADDQKDLLGSWSGKGDAKDVISLLSGLRAASPKTQFVTAQGCEFLSNTVNAKAEDKDLEEAVKLAKGSDAVILAVGEAAWMSGEAAARTNLGLPGRQEELVEKIVATGKPVVVVLMNGRPLAIPWVAENAPALVEAWQLGLQAGPAIADVLFGDYAPTGRLTVTFPRVVGQEPIYYARHNTGRPPQEGNGGAQKWTSKYIDVHWTPQFPFGYGLTYTAFKYSNLVVPAQVKLGGTAPISVDVTNTGDRDGEELVQLYIQDIAASMDRPIRELKDFQRVVLKAGETKTVTFQLPTSKLAFLGEDLKMRTEPGEFKVWAAPNAQDGLEGAFALTAK